MNALAPGWKVIDSTVAFDDSVSEVCVEVLKVAVSPGLTGAIGDVDQLLPVFQTPEPGLGSQTASTASAWGDVARNSDTATRSARIEVARMPGRFLFRRVENLTRCVFTGQAFIGVIGKKKACQHCQGCSLVAGANRYSHAAMVRANGLCLDLGVPTYLQLWVHSLTT